MQPSQDCTNFIKESEGLYQKLANGSIIGFLMMQQQLRQALVFSVTAAIALTGFTSSQVLAQDSALDRLQRQVNEAATGQSANKMPSYFRSGVVGGQTFSVPYTGLSYDPSTGACVTRYKGAVVQTLSSCRKTWTAIVRAGGDAVLFYDRTRGDTEIYAYSSESGIGNLLHKYPAAPTRLWQNVGVTQVTLNLNPGQTYSYKLYFQHNNGEVKLFEYRRDRGLMRQSR